MAFFVKVFSGMMPRLSKRLVDSKTAQKAINVRLNSGELGVMQDNLLVAPGVLTKVGLKKTIYRFGQDVTDESQFWFHWLTNVTVARGTINADTTERTYFMGDVEPRMTYSPLGIAGTGGNYPLAQFKLGIPIPQATIGLTVTSPSITSISNVGTLATATTAVSHNLSTGNTVVIKGATPGAYNGTFTITVTSASQFTYVMATDPAAAATGTITYTLGGLAETRVYGIAFVSLVGEEGAPLVSSLVSVLPGQQVAITGLPITASGNYNLLKKRLYRSVGGSQSTTLRFITDIPLATTTYNDNMLSALLGETITTLGYIPPPDNSFGLVAISNGMLAAISDNQVMFSVPYQPHAWPTAYKYSFNLKPLALGAFGNSVVVLTNGLPSLLTGTDPSDMSQDLIKFGQPCVSAQSVVELAGGVMWASDQGLAFMSSQGFELATTTLFTNIEWAKYKPSSMRAYRWRNRYIAFYDDGVTQGGIVFDKSTGEFWELSFYADAGYTEPRNGDLYLAIDNDILKLDASDSKLTMVWRSKTFVEPKPCRMNIAKVVAPFYPVIFRLYANGILRTTKSVLNGEPFRLGGDYLATDFEVELLGINGVSSVTVAENIEVLRGLAE